MFRLGSLTGLLAAAICIAPWVAADPSAGCGHVEERAVEWNAKAGDIKTFRVNDRNVRVTVPLNYEKGKLAPVIVAFHDKDQSPDKIEYESALRNQKLNSDAIMVYPSADNVCSSSPVCHGICL
jgi:hypothetical protein